MTHDLPYLDPIRNMVTLSPIRQVHAVSELPGPLSDREPIVANQPP